MRLIAPSLRIILALLLLATAIAKAVDLSGMAAIVDSHRVLPMPLTLPAAIAIALTVGVLLLAPGCQVAGTLHQRRCIRSTSHGRPWR